MQYKVTHRLRKQQDDHIVAVDVGKLESIRNPQVSNQHTDASVVMGKVMPASTEFTGTNQLLNPENKALIWQREIRVGNQVVYHHVKDDGQGGLSFFRASVNLKEEPVYHPSQPFPSPQKTAVPVTLEYPLPESIKPEETPLSNIVENSPDPSAKTIITTGIAVNLLALSIGGYLLYSMPAHYTQTASVSPQKVTSTVTIAQTASPQALVNISANESLQTAYRHAQNKDFTTALESLQQIPQGTTAYDIAQAKITEYTEKAEIAEEVAAHQLLQAAYHRAYNQDFAGAIYFIEQIPEGTAAHTTAQTKLIEYQEKEYLLAASQEWQVSQAEKTPFLTASFISTDSPSQQTNSTSSLNLPQTLNPGEFLREVMPKSSFLKVPK